MLNRFVAIAIAASLLASCGGDDDANVLASIQWRFNYGDWTDTSQGAADDMRDCTNQPPDRYAGIDENPYPTVTKVRVFVEDPEGQVPNSDREYDCAMGFGSGKIDILSMVRQVYDITVEGKDAAGNVLYRHKEEGVDLSVKTTHSYELKTITSETTFFTNYSGSPTCPDGVSQLRYSFFSDEAKNADDGEPSVVGSTNKPCSSGTSDTVYARGIPVDPQMGSNDKYNPTMYSIKLEALDSSGAVTYCGWDNVARAFRPGNNKNGNLTGNINVLSGACN